MHLKQSKLALNRVHRLLNKEITKRKKICEELGVNCNKDPYYQQLMGVLKSPVPISIKKNTPGNK